MRDLGDNLLKAMLGQVAEPRWADYEFTIKFKGKREEDGVQMIELQLIYKDFDMIKQERAVAEGEIVENKNRGPDLADNLHHLQGEDHLD